jgi:hypothetical protein
MTQDLTSTRDPFRLAALAPHAPTSDAWPHIEAALRRQRLIRRTTAGLASAAAVCLAIGLYWQLPRLQPGGELSQPLAAQAPATGTVAVNAAADGAAADDNLAALVSLAQQLERNLRALRAGTGVMPAQFLVYQVELEDLVSQVDEAINLQPESRELWSQRVNLLLDLNQLQRQQLRREYGEIASL